MMHIFRPGIGNYLGIFGGVTIRGLSERFEPHAGIVIWLTICRRL
jgi:hypothetical protein